MSKPAIGTEHGLHRSQTVTAGVTTIDGTTVVTTGDKPIVYVGGKPLAGTVRVLPEDPAQALAVLAAQVVGTLPAIPTAPPTTRTPKKGYTLEQAQIIVAKYLQDHKGEWEALTRDGIAKATGVSGGHVSLTKGWDRLKAWQDERRSVRSVPLTGKLLASMPAESMPAEQELSDEVLQLMEEQRKEDAEDERRSNRRHGPS